MNSFSVQEMRVWRCNICTELFYCIIKTI